MHIVSEMCRYNGFELIILYIAEAHAEDVWPVGGLYPTFSHKNINDRLESSKKIKEILNWSGTIYLDNMEDEFLKGYGGWPIGIFAFNIGRLIWRAKPRNSTIEIDDIINFFEQF